MCWLFVLMLCLPPNSSKSGKVIPRASKFSMYGLRLTALLSLGFVRVEVAEAASSVEVIVVPVLLEEGELEVVVGPAERNRTREPNRFRLSGEVLRVGMGANVKGEGEPR